MVRIGVVAALVALGTAVRGEATMRRVAERGPATLVVGGAFTAASPPLMLLALARGGNVGLQACRLGHGVKMLAAGVVLLPAGLALAPLERGNLPDAWLDGIVDAFQEDYCTRPLTAVLP